MSDVPAAARAAVIERCDGRCELAIPGVCLVRYANLSHRLPTGYGDHRPENLVGSCGSGTTGCHGWVEHHPSGALARGWRLRDGQDAALVPLLLSPPRWWPAWWFLYHDGYRWLDNPDVPNPITGELSGSPWPSPERTPR